MNKIYEINKDPVNRLIYKNVTNNQYIEFYSDAPQECIDGLDCFYNWNEFRDILLGSGWKVIEMPSLN